MREFDAEVDLAHNEKKMPPLGKIPTDEKAITKLLMLNSLDETEASRRAPLVLDDFRWIDFEILNFTAQLYPFRASDFEPVVPIPIPEYHFGDTGFSINNAINADDNVAQWFGGTGLDRGHLQFFSKISVIARDLIPQFWQQKNRLRHALRNPTQHLNTLEEVWWLNRWTEVRDIKIGKKLILGSGADVDWEVTLGQNEVRVNQEVKRIQSDCVRHARGVGFSANWFERFCEDSVLPKFGISSSEEVNVLAISLFGELNRKVQLVISDWLTKKQDRIDAILIASREGRRHSSVDWQFRTEKARRLRSFLREPDSEDESMIFALDVPIKIPEFYRR